MYLLMVLPSVRWRAKLDSRVATAPLVAGERVFVVGVDRVVHAFDALDGRRLWQLKRPGDPLTLSQAGVLSAFQDTLLVGQGARLVGVCCQTACSCAGRASSIWSVRQGGAGLRTVHGDDLELPALELEGLRGGG